jgi:hypothetical protein
VDIQQHRQPDGAANALAPVEEQHPTWCTQEHGGTTHYSAAVVLEQGYRRLESRLWLSDDKLRIMVEVFDDHGQLDPLDELGPYVDGEPDAILMFDVAQARALAANLADLAVVAGGGEES